MTNDNPSETGFLEKFMGPVPGSGRSYTVRWVGDPVRTHIMLLLNTRQGAVRHLPDYGMPDVASYYSDYPASLSALRSEIERLIKKYEPRLKSTRVRLIESDRREFKVALLITGEIEESAGMVAVRYRTTITSDGRPTLGD